MDTNNEILDAIEILADRKISENITKVLTGICKSVNINNNTCVMDSNGVSSTVQFYGSPPEVNELYRIFVPSNNMSRSFVVVPPRFTVNPNLLDNWYFANPVNQKGQTSYSNTVDNVYCIDRFINYSVNLDINASNLILSSSRFWYSRIGQKLEQYVLRAIAGKWVTLSILLKSNKKSGQVKISLYDSNDNVSETTEFITATTGEVQLISASFIMPSSYVGHNVEALFYPDLSLNGQAVEYYAAKLELGSTQTLAHLENGNWVLNEIPVYSDQLARCQRYMLQLVNTIDNYEILGGGAAMNTTQVFAFVPTPVSLFKKPFVLNRTGHFVLVRNTAASDGIPITGIGVDHVSSNGVSLICTVDTSLDVGEYYGLWCVPNDAPNSLIISANL